MQWAVIVSFLDVKMSQKYAKVYEGCKLHLIIILPHFANHYHYL